LKSLKCFAGGSLNSWYSWIQPKGRKKKKGAEEASFDETQINITHRRERKSGFNLYNKAKQHIKLERRNVSQAAPGILLL